MDHAGFAISIFDLLTKIYSFALKVEHAGLDQSKQQLELEECAETIQDAAQRIQSIPPMDENGVTSLIELIDSTIDWLSHFVPSNNAKLLTQKHVSTEDLEIQLENKLDALRNVFGAVCENVDDIDSHPPNATTSKSSQRNHLSPINKNIDKFKNWATKAATAAVWVLRKGPKTSLVIEGLVILTKKWSNLATRLSDEPNQSGFYPTISFNFHNLRPIPCSRTVSNMILAGSRNTKEHKQIVVDSIRNQIQSLLQGTAAPILWYHGPASCGKSTLAANLATQLQHFARQDLPQDQPYPVIVTSHVQFVGNSSELCILQDIAHQLHSRTSSSGYFNHTPPSELSSSSLNPTEEAVDSIKSYLSRFPVVLILDGVEADSGLCTDIFKLTKSPGNLKIICFSRDPQPKSLDRNMVRLKVVSPSKLLVEAQVNEVVQDNPKLRPYAKLLVAGLSHTIGSHYGLTSLLLRRISRMNLDEIDDLAASMTIDRYQQLGKHMSYLQRQTHGKALSFVLYIAALSGRLSKRCVMRLGCALHGLIPRPFVDCRSTISKHSQDDPSPTCSSELLPCGVDFAVVLEDDCLGPLLRVDKVSVSLKNPNEAEQILYMIASQDSDLCTDMVNTICLHHSTDRAAVKLLQKIIEAFPESRIDFQRHIEVGSTWSVNLLPTLETANGGPLQICSLFARVDTPRM